MASIYTPRTRAGRFHRWKLEILLIVLFMVSVALLARPSAGDISPDVPGIGPATGQDVLHSCSDARSVACENAVWSVRDGAMQARAICPVGRDFLQNPTLVVSFYLVFEEPDLNRSAHDVILEALRWRFPCERGAND